ncbi:MAG TPA: malate dehydrogenase, partial [Ignisphaera sp.]|nr:malate dehydrogenase [Ignisphaera sp.]
PIASSPMDMVTELDMAIAIALHGGIGVVHRNMSIDQQVEIVSRVKSYPPIKLRNAFVKPNDVCSRVMDYMVSEGIRDLPVVDDLGYVRGYVKLWKLKEICRKGNEVIDTIIDSGTIYNVTEVEKARRSIIRGEFDAIAIVSKEGFYVGTLLLRDAIEEITPVLDKDGRLLVAAAISPFDIDRAKKLDKYVDALVSDVAHFHNINILDSARKLVKEISADFVAGNIGTYEAAIDVIHSVERVDGFRVGIAGGSICITADVAGVYAPTLWAVASVRDAIEDLKLSIPIVADGGIRTSGDAVKALAAGASSVMLGYVLAGTDEASAPLIAVGEKLYKPYRGMASRGAMAKRYAVDRYSRTVKRAPEGVEGLVPYKGPVSKIIKEFVEGIRAGLGYAGARNIEELWRIALFGIAPRKETIQNLF